MKYTLIFAMIILSACASTSDVLQLGPDTYTISGGGVGSGSISNNNTIAKKNSLKEANAYCAQMGKHILVSNINMQSTVFGSTSDITFRCLDASDPEYRRPNFEKEADIKIENK